MSVLAELERAREDALERLADADRVVRAMDRAIEAYTESPDLEPEVAAVCPVCGAESGVPCPKRPRSHAARREAWPSLGIAQ